MPRDRILVIEVAAKRLGMTAIVDSREAAGYEAPSIEADMADISEHVWGGCTPAQEVACEM